MTNREFKSSEVGERFNGGMSLSDAINFGLRDNIKRDESGELTPESKNRVYKMKRWIAPDNELGQQNWWLKMLDALDVREEKARREVAKCFKKSVERALVDEGQLEGDTYKLEYEARKGWEKVEDQGFGVNIDLERGRTSLSDNEGRRIPRMKVDRLSADNDLYDDLIIKYAGVGIASGAAMTILTACSTPMVNITPVVDKTPMVEVTEAARISSAIFMNREEANKITDAGAKDIVNRKLDEVKQYCEKGFGAEKVVAKSETYIGGLDESGKAWVWAFCKADIGGETAMGVVYFNSEDVELNTGVYKKMVMFEDKSVGYVDDQGNKRVIFQHTSEDNYDVLDINGFALIRGDEKKSFLDILMSLGVDVVSAQSLPEGVQIDLNNVIYPPIGSVKESFEAGEYDASIDTMYQWLEVWEKMGIIEGTSVVNPVPLDGRARTICVTTDKGATLLCPPLDLINGGFKAVPADGQWSDADRPIVITFEGTEELTTRGSGPDFAFQFQDKYQKTPTRYIDPKTGQIVEGSIFVKNKEIVENEVIRGSVVCVAKEYCMNGQMEVDQEVAKVFYEKFMDALVHSKANEEYFTNLLGGNISLDALKAYLDAHDGMVPAGLKMSRIKTGAYVKMDYSLDIPVNLSGIKTIVFGSKEWQNNISGIREHLSSYKTKQLINPYSSTEYAWMYFGWYVDENNFLVLVNGSKDGSTVSHPGIIGGDNGVYVPERDKKAATGQILHIIKLMEKFDGYSLLVTPFDSESDASINENDIQRMLGGRNLFK